MSEERFSHRVERLFRAHADAERAVPMEAYMRHRYRFLGLKRPERDGLIKDLTRAWKGGADELILEVDALWALEEREFRYAAIDLMIRHQKLLEFRHIDSLESWILSDSWWDTVDSIGASVLGPLALRSPEANSLFYSWKDSDELWLRRCSIIYMLKHARSIDEPRLFEILDAQLGHTDFFINKAVGWMLRTYARIEPARVKAYVSSRPLSALSRREALKRI
jgi:3-methyladenine DNA glycosylase AlkD